MEVQVSGYQNNRPVLTTYRISDETLAEALTSSDVGKYFVTENLDTNKEYALVNGKGEFSGLIIFLDDTTTAVITTLLRTDWEPGAKFRIHNVEELNTRLNY